MNKKIVKLLAVIVLMLVSNASLTRISAEAEPLASIGSYWNYWVVTLQSHGFYKYEVVKDTVITAPMFDTNEQKTVTASWIEKRAFLSILTSSSPMNDHSAEAATTPAFAAFREGNASYIFDNRTKKWFKWIDMDAKPGDKWMTVEFISGIGQYDYVEISYLDTLNFDGKEVPFLNYIPSCSSRYSTDKDYTSRIRTASSQNIDYWSLYSSPEPEPNGEVYKPTTTYEERVYGLLCAKVNDEYLVTDQLKEYIRLNNTEDYENEIFDCDNLKAPIARSGQSAKRMYDYPEHFETPAPKLFQRNVTPEINAAAMPVRNNEFHVKPLALNPTDIIEVPVVFHVVHNPSRPEGKIEMSQIQNMIDELNDAYSKTREENVREPFKNVVGNPYIQFKLAEESPEGNATNGVVYHETDKQYYILESTEDIRKRYAFKFNEDGSGRNWDHTRYTNIYIVDLGGFDDITNIGGFVTNPEATNMEEYANLGKWLSDGDFTFWKDWVESEEASLLDGLTVDTWYTFGGVSESNPNATFGTAIHELGHYFGLRHISVTLYEDVNKQTHVYDDGFSDTPSTNYNQYKFVPCGQDVYQCGNLVQVENYMDYALDCACMFTIQQSAFMRSFLQNVRPHLIGYENGGTDTKDINVDEIVIYPNPAREYIRIEGEFKSARIIESTGRMVMSVPADQHTVYLNNFNPGIYFVITELENGKNIVNKIIIEVVK